jgi:hypothetical protein
MARMYNRFHLLPQDHQVRLPTVIANTGGPSEKERKKKNTKETQRKIGIHATNTEEFHSFLVLSCQSLLYVYISLCPLLFN